MPTKPFSWNLPMEPWFRNSVVVMVLMSGFTQEVKGNRRYRIYASTVAGTWVTGNIESVENTVIRTVGEMLLSRISINLMMAVLDGLSEEDLIFLLLRIL